MDRGVRVSPGGASWDTGARRRWARGPTGRGNKAQSRTRYTSTKRELSPGPTGQENKAQGLPWEIRNTAMSPEGAGETVHRLCGIPITFSPINPKRNAHRTQPHSATESRYLLWP